MAARRRGRSEGGGSRGSVGDRATSDRHAVLMIRAVRRGVFQCFLGREIPVMGWNFFPFKSSADARIWTPLWTRRRGWHLRDLEQVTLEAAPPARLPAAAPRQPAEMRGIQLRYLKSAGRTPILFILPPWRRCYASLFCGTVLESALRGEDDGSDFPPIESTCV